MFLLFWLILGAVLLLVELLTTSFFIIFFGLAAFTIALLAFFFTLTMNMQVMGFLAISILYLLFLRRFIRQRKRRQRAAFAPNAPIGEWGVAYDDINPNSYGRVVIRDTIWRAKATTFVKKGSSIQVISQNNLTLEVQCHY